MAVWGLRHLLNWSVQACACLVTAICNRINSSEAMRVAVLLHTVMQSFGCFIALTVQLCTPYVMGVLQSLDCTPGCNCSATCFHDLWHQTHMHAYQLHAEQNRDSVPFWL